MPQLEHEEESFNFEQGLIDLNKKPIRIWSEELK